MNGLSRIQSNFQICDDNAHIQINNELMRHCNGNKKRATQIKTVFLFFLNQLLATEKKVQIIKIFNFRTQFKKE